MYLEAVIDWYSKSILSLKLSNTMDVSLAVNVLDSAIGRDGAQGFLIRTRGHNILQRSIIRY